MIAKCDFTTNGKMQSEKTLIDNIDCIYPITYSYYLRLFYKNKRESMKFKSWILTDGEYGTWYMDENTLIISFRDVLKLTSHCHDYDKVAVFHKKEDGGLFYIDHTYICKSAKEARQKVYELYMQVKRKKQ